MRKRFMILGIVVIILLFSGCAADNHVKTNTDNDIVTSQWDPDTFREMRNMNLTAVDSFVNTLSAIIEQKDTVSMERLFAPNLLTDCLTDDDIELLYSYVEGSVVSANRVSAHGSESKNEGEINAFIMISIDLETTVATYRIAVKASISDTLDDHNIGICSLYITKAENTDTQFAYWGDHEWLHGIVIENK